MEGCLNARVYSNGKDITNECILTDKSIAIPYEYIMLGVDMHCGSVRDMRSKTIQNKASARWYGIKDNDLVSLEDIIRMQRLENRIFLTRVNGVTTEIIYHDTEEAEVNFNVLKSCLP